MPHFTIISSAAGPVSILNPVSVEPVHGQPSGSIPRQIPEPPQVGRKYQCATCSKTFTTSGHLVRHGRIHLGTKDYVCPYQGCHKSCSRQDNLTQHYRVHLPMHDRKQPNVFVRDRMAEMRQQNESLAPLPTEVKKSPSPVSSNETNSARTSASPTPMQLTFAATSSRPQRQGNRSPTQVLPRLENRSGASSSIMPTSSGSGSQRPSLIRFPRYEPGEGRDQEDSPGQEQSASPLTPFSPTTSRTESEWSPVTATLENYPNYRISYARGGGE